MGQEEAPLQYKELDNKELFDRLHSAEIAELLRSDPKWALLEEARKRIVDRAIFKFVTDQDHTNVAKTIEFKIIIKKYLYGLFSEVEQMAKEGDILFDELQDRGVRFDLDITI